MPQVVEAEDSTRRLQQAGRRRLRQSGRKVRLSNEQAVRRRLTGDGFEEPVASVAHRRTRMLVSRARSLGAFAIPVFFPYLTLLIPHVSPIGGEHFQPLLNQTFISLTSRRLRYAPL